MTPSPATPPVCDARATLLPCPFCEGVAEFERIGDRRASTRISCTNCGAMLETGEELGTANIPGRLWNTRTTTAPPPVADEARMLAEQLRNAMLSTTVGRIDPGTVAVVSLDLLLRASNALLSRVPSEEAAEEVEARIWTNAAQIIEAQDGMSGWKRRIAAMFRDKAIAALRITRAPGAVV